MTPTKRSLKRPICEAMKIITSELNRYPQIEKAFKEYDLAWIIKGGDTFFPVLVREFYANNQAILDNICKTGVKFIDILNMNQIPVRGVMVNLSDHIIN